MFSGLFFDKSDLGGILTHDLQNRNLTLYTAKLRDRKKSFRAQAPFQDSSLRVQR